MRTSLNMVSFTVQASSDSARRTSEDLFLVESGKGPYVLISKFSNLFPVLVPLERTLALDTAWWCCR